MPHQLTPDDITRVTEAEFRADLTTFIDCVAFAEDEDPEALGFIRVPYHDVNVDQVRASL